MITVLLSVALLIPVAEPPKLTDAAKKELKNFEGSWEVVRLETGGNVQKPEKGEAIVTFEGAKLKVTLGEKVQQEAEVVALDPTTSPMCFDLKNIPANAKREGLVYEAVFKIEGDMLHYCVYNGKDKQRPTGFDTPKDDDTQLFVLKRVKQ